VKIWHAIFVLYSTYWLLLRSGIVQSVPCNCDQFLICCAFPIWVLIILNSSTNFLYCGCSRHLVAKRGESGLEIAAEFCQSASLIPQGFFNMAWNLMTWGRRLYFPFEGNRAADFIALEVHRSWPCLNLRTFGSSGKHDNNYITENDFISPRVDTHFSDFEQAIPYHQW
jgi:hypothetical protein